MSTLAPPLRARAWLLARRLARSWPARLGLAGAGLALWADIVLAAADSQRHHCAPVAAAELALRGDPRVVDLLGKNLRVIGFPKHYAPPPRTPASPPPSADGAASAAAPTAAELPPDPARTPWWRHLVPDAAYLPRALVVPDTVRGRASVPEGRCTVAFRVQGDAGSSALVRFVAARVPRLPADVWWADEFSLVPEAKPEAALDFVAEDRRRRRAAAVAAIAV